MCDRARRLTMDAAVLIATEGTTCCDNENKMKVIKADGDDEKGEGYC